MTVLLERRLFTADEYFQMIEAGILGKQDRVELIEGEIVQMPPTGDFHAGMLNRLVRLFKPLVGTEAVFSPQNPIRLAENNAPEPDAALLRFRADDYLGIRADPQDVLLLIEIADSSLRTDQRIKAPLYAQNGISELWIINMAAKSVEVHRQPSDAGYLHTSIAKGSDLLSPLAFPAISFTVDELFR